MRNRLVVLSSLAVIAVARVAAAATVDVALSGFSFAPQTVNIQIGDTVRWTNSTDNIHDLRADDGSFSTDAGTSWVFTHTFNAPGTFGYFCTFHGGPRVGMFGTVVVAGGGGAPNAGTLRFSQASYSVGEANGSATITVQRVDGDDGAVAVQYAATAGTATGGADFTPTSGTLSWPDGDDGSKSFAVMVFGDAVPEPIETVQLALSNASGGAAIDPTRQSATLQIVDDDIPPGGNPPAAPTNLQATSQSTTSVALSWSDNANNETAFLIESRTVDNAFAQVASVGANVTSTVVSGLEPSTFYLFRVRAIGNFGFSVYSNEASATTEGVVAACVAGAETLCLNNARFRTAIVWRSAESAGRGQAVPVPTAPDSGLFYFFSPANLEMLIKVLNACIEPLGNRYWVYFAATTNVEFAVTVTDTQTGKTKTYFNPLNRAAPPVQDVDAFATCP